MSDPHLVVEDLPARVQYAGNGVQRDFPFAFTVLDAGDIQAWLGDTQQTAGFTVVLAEDGRGTVTFTSAPAAGQLVTLRRLRPYRRVTDFQQSGLFRAKVINDELDALEMQIQQLRDEVSRSVRLSPVAGDVNVQLPYPLQPRRALLTNPAANGLVLSTYDPDTTVETSQQALATSQLALDKALSAEAAAAAAGVGSIKAWGPFTLVAGQQRYPLPAAVAKPEDVFLNLGAVPQTPQWTITDELGVGMTLTITPVIAEDPDAGEWPAGAVIWGKLISGLTSAAVGSKIIELRHLADAPPLRVLESDDAGRPYWAPAKASPGWYDPVDFGADGTFLGDSTAAFLALRDAMEASPRGIRLSPGRFRVKELIELRNVPMMLAGYGKGLSVCEWPGDATSRGLRIRITDWAHAEAKRQFHHIRDLTLATDSMSGEALTLDYSGQVDDGVLFPGKRHTWDRWSPRFQVENVNFRGATGQPLTSGWDVGLRSIAAVKGNVDACDFAGYSRDVPTTAACSASAFVFQGDRAGYENGHPVSFRVTRGSLTYAQNAVVFENCEGCEVDDTDLLSCIVGVSAISQFGHPRLVVTRCDTACISVAVLADGMNHVRIAQNEFLNPADSPVPLVAVVMRNTAGIAALGGHQLIDNVFQRTSVNPGGVMSGISAEHMQFGRLGGNFFGELVTAIWLTSGTSNCLVSNTNVYRACGINVLDQGSNNVVVP